jgi:hypothetical protein
MDNAPGSWGTVVATRDGERAVLGMRWGFQIEILGENRLVFNTKSEGVRSSPLCRTDGSPFFREGAIRAGKHDRYLI